jgi:long-chain acyl-CoA synthetase
VGELGFWNVASNNPGMEYLIEPDHTVHTAGELLAACNQVVHGLRDLGLEKGDTIAVLLPNGAPFVELLFAAGQAGWYLVPINWHLVGPEIAYIVNDSGAKAFIAHERFTEEAGRAAKEIELPDHARFAVGELDGFRAYTELKDGQPTDLPDDRSSGALMNYTSGTTGQPKGVRRDLPELDPDTVAEMASFLNMLFGIEPFDDNVHLVVAPMYHTAVGQFAQAAFHAGHKVVLMDKWTPEGTLERIERHRVTTSHMVPTMFHRMLNLPEDVRAKYDVSSVRRAVHSAAPCPVPTKHAMLDWWGPVVWEYYAATEGGGTLASPEDWLTKPGTVGKPWPISEIKILDDDGAELAPHGVGTVWMRMGDRTFSYHGDEEKTKKTWNEQGFFTVGDAGYVDEDGWLFLCDRKNDMIISGGANIYPAEVESVLMQHPAVLDAAIFGIPNDDWGEEVKAAVQLKDGYEAGPDMERKIIDFCAEHVAKFKLPRTVDFHVDFPRTATGKLLKRELRDPYWEGRQNAIV